MIRVLLVDDQPLIRTAVRAIVEQEPDIEVVGEASDGRQAVDSATLLRPDVVVMDIQMPGTDGVEATRILCSPIVANGPRVLVMTTFEDDETVARALRAGASGFIGKGVDPREIIQAIRTVADGNSLLSPLATASVIKDFVSRQLTTGGDTAALESLTPREREIVVLVGRGLSNDEIATRLYISPATAKTHVNRAMTKLDARDRAQLVIAAYENGMLA